MLDFFESHGEKQSGTISKCAAFCAQPLLKNISSSVRAKFHRVLGVCRVLSEGTSAYAFAPTRIEAGTEMELH
jgi:hypothetical protein